MDSTIDHWIFIDEKLFSKQFLEVANTRFARPFVHTRASSDSFVESRTTEISTEIETG